MTDTIQREHPPAPVPPDTLLRPKQVEAAFPITANHLAQLRFRGEGPRYSRRGHLIIYRAGDVWDWLMDGIVEPSGAAS